jgi:hypothetical protein
MVACPLQWLTDLTRHRMKVASCIAHATCGEFSFRLVYVEVTRLNVETAAIRRLEQPHVHVYVHLLTTLLGR